MKAPPEHATKLAKRAYLLRIQDTNVFEPDELTLLLRYGYWLEAMAEQRIEALTDAQKRFVAVTTKKLKPESLFEIAWMKLMVLRDIEQLHVPHYDICDPKQNDEDQAAMRKFCTRCSASMPIADHNSICDGCISKAIATNESGQRYSSITNNWDHWDYSAIK
jgi:uncharacterized protein YifE (UPF0438 family)